MIIPEGMKKSEYIKQHLLKCGTCKYYRNGICNNLKNETYGDILDEDCSCDEGYIPERQVERYL